MKIEDYIINKPILETTRLKLRELNENDVSDLKEWLSDMTIYEYWGKRPSKAEINPELLFHKEKKSSKSFHWGIIHKGDKKVIGEIWVYLIEKDRMAKVAFRLSPFYHGERLMSEALKEVIHFCFTCTELKRLWSDVHILNHASYKTLEKVGFKREGLIREGKMVSVFCDYYIYGMLKSDFEQLKD